MKQCRTCETWKGERSYSVNKKNKLDGLNTECRECDAVRQKKTKDKHREKRRAEWHIWHDENKEEKKEYNRNWQRSNPDKKSAQDRRYRAKNRDKIDAKVREYAVANRDKIRKYQHRYARDYHKRTYQKSTRVKLTPEQVAERNRLNARAYYWRNKELCLEKNRVRHASLSPEEKQSKAKQRAKWILTEKGRAYLSRTRHRRRSREKESLCDLTAQQWNDILLAQNNHCAICAKRFHATLKATKDHIIPLSAGGGLTKSNVQALCLICNCKKHTKMPVPGQDDLNRRSLA